MTEVHEESFEPAVLPFKEEMQSYGDYMVYSDHNNNNVYLFLSEHDFFELTEKSGDKTSDFNIACLTSCIHVDDLDLFQYESLVQKGSTSFNVRVIKPDDTISIFNIVLTECDLKKDNRSIVYNAALNNVKDMPVSEEAGHAYQNNFDAMLKHTNDFIFFKNMYHILTACSQSLADITGFAKGSDLIGLTDYDIFSKEHADRYYELEKEIYQGKHIHIEETQPFFDADGNEGWVNNRKYPIKDQQGAVIGLFGVARIVTEEVQRQKELEKAQKKLLRLANYDSLTSLLNRRHGTFLCERAFEEAKRYGDDLSLIMFDIDHFKRVNDLYGHECGDKTLTYMAELIEKLVRGSDIFLRYGGEEFVICLPRTDLNGAKKLADRITTKLADNKIECINDWITVSGGVVQLENEKTFEELTCRADQLLYEAKGAGRNCFKF